MRSAPNPPPDSADQAAEHEPAQGSKRDLHNACEAEATDARWRVAMFHASLPREVSSESVSMLEKTKAGEIVRKTVSRRGRSYPGAIGRAKHGRVASSSV